MQILSQLNRPDSLPPALREEIRALEREGDAELAEEGLLNLSSRLAREGHLEPSVELCRLLAGQARESTVADRARERYQAIEGGSSGWARWEFLASRFTEELLDPAALIGMGVAGLTFRGARLLALTRMSRSVLPYAPGPASGLATALGLSAEIPAFVLAARLSHGAMGRPLDWSASALRGEFASTALLLGCLRLSGSLATNLLRPYSAGPLSLGAQLGVGVGLGQQTAMFGGILASRYLETRLGLRPAFDGEEDLSAMLSEGLAALIHFNAAGRLARVAFGPRWAAFERNMDLHAQGLATPLNLRATIRPEGGGVSGIRPHSTPSTWRRHLREVLLSPMWMMLGAGGPGGGGPSRPLRATLDQLLRETVSPETAVSREARQELARRFPSLDLSEQSRILHALLRSANAYDGALQDRLADGLAELRPLLRPETDATLLSYVDRHIASGSRRREFERLLQLGFSPTQVAPLTEIREIQVAPRVLDYLEDQGTHPEAHGVAQRFLRRVLELPPESQRDIAMEIIRRGWGEGALGHLYPMLRDSGHLEPVVEAWSTELQWGSLQRRWQAIDGLHFLCLVAEGNSRSAAVGLIVGRLHDADPGIRAHARGQLADLERALSTPQSRREYLRGFEGLLARGQGAFETGRLSPELLEELRHLPISARYRLTQRLLAKGTANASARNYIEESMQDSAFIDFVLNPRYAALRSEGE